MIGNKTNEIFRNPFNLLLEKYQIALEESVKGSDFVFDHADELYCKCSKISLNLSGLFIDCAVTPKRTEGGSCPRFLEKKVKLHENQLLLKFCHDSVID